VFLLELNVYHVFYSTGDLFLMELYSKVPPELEFNYIPFLPYFLPINAFV